MRLLNVILLLVLSVNVQWVYAYDADLNTINYKAVDFELENEHYDGTSNLCYSTRQCINSYSQKKTQDGAFFAFIGFGNDTKGAFEVAQAGGRNSGQLTQFLKQTATQLGRSIRKFDKNVVKHENWIANPKSKIPEWDTFSAQRQANTIHHWKEDIARARELQTIAKGVAKQKGF